MVVSAGCSIECWRIKERGVIVIIGGEIINENKEEIKVIKSEKGEKEKEEKEGRYST